VLAVGAGLGVVAAFEPCASTGADCKVIDMLKMNIRAKKPDIKKSFRFGLVIMHPHEYFPAHFRCPLGHSMIDSNHQIAPQGDMNLAHPAELTIIWMV
jgi:hypothetical protein